MYRNGFLEYRPCFDGLSFQPREGFDLDTIRKDLLNENPSYGIAILKAKMVNISSTIIRNGIAAGKDMSEWLM